MKKASELYRNYDAFAGKELSALIANIVRFAGSCDCSWNVVEVVCLQVLE